MSLKVTKQQIILIHVAKKHLKDEEYVSALSGYGVESSKELTYDQAQDLIKKFIERGLLNSNKKSFNSKHGWGKKKYEHLGNRGSQFPTPAQLRMIEAIWKERAEVKTDEALRKFIKRITGKDDILWLFKTDIEKIKKAVENL